jgi:signal transduction histidine kinase
VRWWAAAAQWRNWPLLVKLAMVLLVPVVGGMVLGVLRVNADVQLADSYADIARIASVRAELVPTLSAIQHERNLAMQQPGGRPSDFREAAAETDRVIGTTDRLIREIPNLGEAAATGYRNLTPAFGSLQAMRELVASNINPASVLSGYTVVINAVLNFDRTLVGRFPDQALSGTSAALYDFQQAHEQVSLQQATVLVGLARGSMTDAERDTVVKADVRLNDRLADASAVAPPALWQRYLVTVVGEDVERRENIEEAIQDGQPLTYTVTAWDRASNITGELMASVASGAAAQLQQDSEHLQDRISNRAGAQAVLLLIMVLLATGIGGVLGRYLLRSLGLLRRTALDVAHNRLPAAVASIRAGTAKKIDIEPVPLRTTEEFGQLARAFDAVNSQAVRSAAEEAGLRSNMRNIFMNLSRRSQGLVERQLRLMEQLEQRSEDPEALADLFKLDHLATRMRRNNENLMVLSGMDVGRRTSEPMLLVDVLRAAVSEVEQYQRAVVRSAPQARIVGYAAGDLGRTVAELVENATAFSPPDSQVIITSALDVDGTVRIEILDSGIGMGDTELADANGRVAAGGGMDVPVSRQMGLFVVGRLTSRHGILARLNRREDGQGLRALVLVPPELVTLDPTLAPEPEPEVVEPAVVEPAVVETNGDAGRLELAGIIARLPALPFASSPASILFAAHRPVEQQPAAVAAAAAAKREFTWLGSGAAKQKPPGAPAPAAPVAPVASVAAVPPPIGPQSQTIGPAGLPKRVPQAQLLAAQPRGPVSRAPAVPARDAARARGFLTNFQAGVRRNEHTEGETSP